MLKRMLWRLASPYDAYVSHVARLEEALHRIRMLSERTAGYEMGLRGSVRLRQGEADAAQRADRFRRHLSTDSNLRDGEHLESFITELGGGETAEVEQDRADISIRMDHATVGLKEYFAIAGSALKTLEQRAYDPTRRDVARQLASNRIVPRSLSVYQDEFRELTRQTGQTEAAKESSDS